MEKQSFTNLFKGHNKNITRKSVSGFSIIEIIIYLAIFTILSIVVINSFIVVLASFSTIRTNHDLLDSGSVAIDRISHEIRQAKNIDLVNSNFDSDTSTLYLNSTDGLHNVVFSKIGNTLDISKDGDSVGNLLTQNIYLNKLIFSHIVTVKSEAVKIEIEIEDTRSKIIRKEKFYNTVVLRGGY